MAAAADVVQDRRLLPDGSLRICEYTKGLLLGKVGPATRRSWCVRSVIERPVAQGAYAKCYSFTYLKKLRLRLVAGKVISKSSLVKPTAKAKVRPRCPARGLWHICTRQCGQVIKEIKIHRELRHENIVKLKSFFEDRLNVYIMMELCPNGVRFQH